MSRIGKRSIPIPQGASVSLAGDIVTVKGPHGTLTRQLYPGIEIKIAEEEVAVAPKNENDHLLRALWGTYAAHVGNMLRGVTEQFSKKLIIEGVGYRAEVAGDSLKLMVGFSHPVIMPIPQGVSVKVEKGEITLSCIDKEALGQFAANIRSVRPPEPYKGKGIHYEGEVIRRKQGKKGTA